MAGPWPPTAPLPPVVAFDWAAWKAAFPDFVNVSEGYATGCFARASMLCQNNAASPVVTRNGGDAAQLSYFLNLLTAHIVWLNCPQVNGLPNDGGGGVPSPLVGRISQATEGSVSVAAEIDGGNQPAGAAYYFQTKWGIEYWQASAGYRQMVYSSPLLSGARARFRGFSRGLGVPWGW
jgi:hypothetical protein